MSDPEEATEAMGKTRRAGRNDQSRGTSEEEEDADEDELAKAEAALGRQSEAVNSGFTPLTLAFSPLVATRLSLSQLLLVLSLQRIPCIVLLLL